MSSTIKAIVFDSDGTLFDSFSVYLDAYVHIAGVLGYAAPTAAEVRAQLAQAYPTYQIMATFFPGGDPAEMIRINNEYVMKNAFNVRSFDGVRELLAGLHGRGLKLAILTGGNAKVEAMYKHHELDHYFDSFVHCDRVVRSKPDPEGLLLAAQECGALPHETIMIGDSPADIFAGKNAGAAITIAITHGNASKMELQAADPDYTVHSLAELDALLLTLTSKQ